MRVNICKTACLAGFGRSEKILNFSRKYAGFREVEALKWMEVLEFLK